MMARRDVDAIYRTRQELERRGLNSCHQHRDAILRADQQAWRLIEWTKITTPIPLTPLLTSLGTPGSDDYT
jgi:hypothetical protein